ncbi:MAG: biotin/lipoyl-binding protein [Actinomycetales bacterium]|nr:biotin/lipoyl-binding protein [Actinomycetales bacterium]
MKLKVTVNGAAYDVEVDVEEEPPPTLGGFYLQAAAPVSAAAPPMPTQARNPADEGKALRAAISGTVTRVVVAAGQAVEAGETLLVLEAMKMETEITAPAAGTVAAVAVSPGEAVTGGQVLIEWE